MSDIDFKIFPKTRYQGSKRKILPWLHENVKDLEFHTVLDAFGGSSTVSYMFKKMGKEVTYNDNLRFNYLIAKALIANQSTTLIEEDIQNLIQWISLNPADDFIEKTFSRVYYYKRENKWLDGICHGIINMNHYEGEELEYKKAIAYYALFQACLIKRPFNLFHRRNLYIRRNKVDRTFGNKVTWETSFETYFERFIKEANQAVFNSGVPCHATNLSVFDIDRTDYDLVYLDPPYLSRTGSNESANYVRCYHFLEGIANYQNWPTWIDFSSINKRFSSEVKQNEFQAQNIEETYDNLFQKFRDSIIVLSYKDGGTPSIQTLKKIMRKYKAHVSTVSRPYSYALNKANANMKEVLIIGK